MQAYGHMKTLLHMHTPAHLITMFSLKRDAEKLIELSNIQGSQTYIDVNLKDFLATFKFLFGKIQEFRTGLF